MRSTQWLVKQKGRREKEKKVIIPSKCLGATALLNGFNRPVFGVLSNEHLSAKRVINWIVCVESGPVTLSANAGDTMYQSVGGFPKMLVLLFLVTVLFLFCVLWKYLQKPNNCLLFWFQSFIPLTAHDYSHRKLWLSGWHGKQWRELSADAIHMSSWLHCYLNSPTCQRPIFLPHKKKSYLHCCTKPERLQGTHFTVFWCVKFWKPIKKILISESYYYNCLHFRFPIDHSVTLKNSANDKWTDLP